MLTDNKVIKLFCPANGFCEFFEHESKQELRLLSCTCTSSTLHLYKQCPALVQVTPYICTSNAPHLYKCNPTQPQDRSGTVYLLKKWNMCCSIILN